MNIPEMISLCEKSHAEYAQISKVRNKMRKFITGHEYALVFGAINWSMNAIRDRAMFQLAYRHGLRVSEMTDMRLAYPESLRSEGAYLFNHWLNRRGACQGKQ